MITAAVVAIFVQVHGLSVHARSGYAAADGERVAYSGFNPGVGLRAEFSRDWAFQAGAYRNSYRRNSLYAAADWTPIEYRGVRLGAFAGIVNRYPMAGGGFAPAAGLSIRRDASWGNVTVRVVPPCGVTAGAIAIEAGWRL